MASGNGPGFFDLPPEIRNRVYELVFPCRDRTAYNPVLHFRKIEPCRCFEQPLMRVSKQVRAESVSLHYSIHEFHFVLFPPNKTVLLSWLDNVARDSISYIRRVQLKRYVEGKIHYLGERIMTVTIDLNEESEVDIRVAGKRMVLPVELNRLVRELPHVDGRQQLTKESLLGLFEFVGWH